MLKFFSRRIFSKPFSAGTNCLDIKTFDLSMDIPTVQTKYGLLAGTIRENVEGGKYFAFMGVPFAEPPIGNLRFKEPQPLKPWEGVKYATKEGSSSVQCEASTRVTEGSEDCLFLNVATNSLTGKEPVLVWIHGGGFKYSSSTYNKYSPDYLLKKNVVFVSMNYRLGVLGFLNMEHEECAGSQGLKDQIAALKWVQENIEAFGGDSQNVTIFGESAGAASVHGLCLAPQAKGLFHKAISHSGVISCPWAHIDSNKKYGFALAKALGKDCSNSLDAIEFLRSFPAAKLAETYDTYQKSSISNLLFTLVPTPDVKSSNPILPQPIEKTVEMGVDVPLLIGYNSHEGILFFLGEYEQSITETSKNFEKVLAGNLKIDDPKKSSNIAKVVRKFYFGEDEITEKKMNELVQLFGDMQFVNDIQKVVEIQMGKPTSTYMYRYSYQADFPTMKDRFNCKIEGTCHSDELGCLLYAPARRKRIEEGTRDRKVMERMTTMWTNFAKTGNPTPVIDDVITTKWLPVARNKKYYLEINDSLKCGENPDNDARQMWKALL